MRPHEDDKLEATDFEKSNLSFEYSIHLHAYIHALKLLCKAILPAATTTTTTINCLHFMFKSLPIHSALPYLVFCIFPHIEHGFKPPMLFYVIVSSVV
jgi:hypothetical protein